MSDCKHRRIITYTFEDSGEPSGLWGCADCLARFAPVTKQIELENELSALRSSVRQKSVRATEQKLREVIAERDMLRNRRAEIDNEAFEYAEQVCEQGEVIAALRNQLAEARGLVDQQSEDAGLWCEAETVIEAYLQQELRRLHAVIEGMPTQ